MPSRLIALAAGVAALTATGCGEQQIDVKKSAKLIQTSVEEQIGADVKTIKCPDQVKVKAKAVFTCRVTGADGTTGTASVTQIDGKGTISVTAPFLPKNEAEQSLQADLRKRSPRATVVCPDIIIMKLGGKFECQANRGEVNDTIFATQTNARGSFRYTTKGRE
jgi:hypothetical protein